MATDTTNHTPAFSVRLSADELRVLADLAERLGVSRSDIVRMALRGRLPDDPEK